MGALGAVLGPSLAPLGALLGHIGAILRPQKHIGSEKARRQRTLIFLRFLKDFGVCSLSSFRRLKTAQEAIKIAPILPKKPPRWPQDGPRGSQDGPKRAPRQSKMSSKTAKMAQGGLQDGPKTHPKRPRCPRREPEMAQYASNTVQDGPKTASLLFSPASTVHSEERALSMPGHGELLWARITHE